MPDQTSHGTQCNEFELLLSDALDGVLSGPGLDRFQAHAHVCQACGPLLAEAEAGRNWLKGLTEVEPPASMVTNILASTTGVDTQRLRVTARSLQPRFAMSFGMAFFALSVGLTVAGVKPADLRQISLRPTAIRHTYYATQARVVHYYLNVRIVYEVESRVRELKRTVAPAEPGPSQSRPAKQKDDKNDTTQQPEQKQERNYSQTDNHLILASAPLGSSLRDLPVVSVTTYRRFV
jgi:hypothetical protein